MPLNVDSNHSYDPLHDTAAHSNSETMLCAQSVANDSSFLAKIKQTDQIGIIDLSFLSKYLILFYFVSSDSMTVTDLTQPRYL